MKKIQKPRGFFYIWASFFIVTINFSFSEEKKIRSNQINYEIHNGYFVSNKYEPKKTQSFIISDEQKGFDSVFGVAFLQGDKSNRLKEKWFDSKIVISTIKRGSFFCEYEVSSITNNNGEILLRYNTKEKKSSTAEFSCPLIISIPKNNYKSVKFIENGKLIKKLLSK